MKLQNQPFEVLAGFAGTSGPSGDRGTVAGGKYVLFSRHEKGSNETLWRVSVSDGKAEKKGIDKRCESISAHPELGQLLSTCLTAEEADTLSDLLFRRISYDVVAAWLDTSPRPEWSEFSIRAQAALDKARAKGDVRLLAGASLRPRGWFLRPRGRTRRRGRIAGVTAELPCSPTPS